MAAPAKIRIMISSKCRDKLGDGKTTFTEVRRQLKKRLEEEKLLGSELFEVWINEDAAAAAGSQTAEDECLEQVARADVVVVLYNGDAGWVKEGGEGNIGICHAELKTAFDTAPAKIRAIVVEPVRPELAKNAVHKRFQEFFNRNSFFRGGKTGKTVDEILECVMDAVREATADMVHLGVREAKKGKYGLGEALDWSHETFLTRSEKIRSVLISGLNKSWGGEPQDKSSIVVKLLGKRVLFCCHGLPGAMTEASAREIVGRPFLKDHEKCESMDEAKCFGGPVHLIGCNRSATETQALKLIGFPDAIVVSHNFGVYVADPVYKAQLVFITNCRDETNTLHGLQRFMDWLEQSGENELVLKRAAVRKKILKTISSEVG
jgi:Domain of unknown function (DUF4062)